MFVAVLVACLMFSVLPAVVSKMFPVSLQSGSYLVPTLEVAGDAQLKQTCCIYLVKFSDCGSCWDVFSKVILE